MRSQESGVRRREVFSIVRGFATLLIMLVLSVPTPAQADEVLVAVAANFLNPMKEIGALFKDVTGHQATLIPGSSGKLYAQLRHGAPFEVFLSADAERPQLLEEAGLAVKGSRFTYAVGRLALWSRHPRHLREGGREALAEGAFRHVAVANPKTAPYGRAAVQVMRKWAVWERLRPRLVQGANIAQTFQFVASGNAEVGFVALSQVVDPRFNGSGTFLPIPTDLHDPLRQDVVLLRRGRSNSAAVALMEFLRTDKARAVIKRYGYHLG